MEDTATLRNMTSRSTGRNRNCHGIPYVPCDLLFRAQYFLNHEFLSTHLNSSRCTLGFLDIVNILYRDNDTQSPKSSTMARILDRPDMTAIRHIIVGKPL